HYHLDHVVGLPAVGRLIDTGWTVHVFGPPTGGEDGGPFVRALLDGPYWPEELGGKLQFSALPQEGSLRIGRLTARWTSLNHPGGSVGYRIDGANGSAAVVSDFEWSRSSPDERDGLIRLLASPSPVQLLFCEGQYTEAELRGRSGWGHSTQREAVEIGHSAGVQQLVLIHHDPTRSDAELEQLSRDELGETVAIGREGDLWLVDASGSVVSPRGSGGATVGFGDAAHLRWLAERYHDLTVLTDAKAGFLIALNGALAAGTFQALGSRSEVPSGTAGWLVAYLITVLAAALAAFGVLWPRREVRHAGKAPVFFFGAVSLCRDGGDLRRRLHARHNDDLLDELADNAVAMASIVEVKVRRVFWSVVTLCCSGVVWAVLIGWLFVWPHGNEASHSSSASSTEVTVAPPAPVESADSLQISP
ncbi:MAG: hypothetical protein KC729_14945, partial [Candidatus Eisenbacteria bacterium]|nr:hypothetical protein [Candidatus Eisenbacteria bacterium]